MQLVRSLCLQSYTRSATSSLFAAHCAPSPCYAHMPECRALLNVNLASHCAPAPRNRSRAACHRRLAANMCSLCCVLCSPRSVVAFKRASNDIVLPGHSFLMGPKRQCNRMKAARRRLATGIYVLAMVLPCKLRSDGTKHSCPGFSVFTLLAVLSSWCDLVRLPNARIRALFLGNISSASLL